MKRRVILFIFLTAVACNVSALSYETTRLQRIGSLLNLEKVIDTDFSDSIYVLSDKKATIGIEFSKTKTITHIGCKLFGDKTSVPPVEGKLYYFLERYLLETLLANPKKLSLNQQLKMDGIRFTCGSIFDLQHLSHADSLYTFNISEQQKRYELSLTHGDSLLCSFSVPKDYELITGKDAIELEKDIFIDLDTTARPHQPNIHIDNLQKITYSPYKICQGDYFISESLTNSYYVKQEKDSSYSLLFSLNHPKQTIANILLFGSDLNLILQMDHHIYGYQIHKCTIPLNAWVDKAYKEGCTPYVGIDKIEKDIIKCSYIWFNEHFGYVHVMEAEFSTRSLYQPSLPVYCSLYSYVSISNVLKLFGEYQ